MTKTKSIPTTPVAPVSAPTKRAQLIALLQGEGGTTLDIMATTLGWLPHTTRAALTGLRKSGHQLISEIVEGQRRYRIVAETEA